MSTILEIIVAPASIVLGIVSFLGMISVTVIGYFLKETMKDLKETKILAFKTKSQLDVLTKDHENKHEAITDKFDDLKDSIVVLTREIKELTKEIKK